MGCFDETADSRVKRFFFVQYSAGVSRIRCQLRCTSSITPRENDIYKQKVGKCVTQHCSYPAQYMTQYYANNPCLFLLPSYHERVLASTVPLTLSPIRPSAHEILSKVLTWTVCTTRSNTQATGTPSVSRMIAIGRLLRRYKNPPQMDSLGSRLTPECASFLWVSCRIPH